MKGFLEKLRGSAQAAGPSKQPAWPAVEVPAGSALPSRGDPDAEELAYRAQDAFDEELAHRTREETERLESLIRFHENLGRKGDHPHYREHDRTAVLLRQLQAAGAEKISTAAPSGDSLGPAGVSWHEVQTLREQLALQSQRADDLQAQVDELQHSLDRKEVEMEELMKVGGTERQSAYIARLLAKITALGGNRSEFDQEGGR